MPSVQLISFQCISSHTFQLTSQGVNAGMQFLSRLGRFFFMIMQTTPHPKANSKTILAAIVPYYATNQTVQTHTYIHIVLYNKQTNQA